tara:strand:- start:1284 stop:1469 length:186 start_codon:yes stop_codon:yes gene_type:complete
VVSIEGAVKQWAGRVDTSGTCDCSGFISQVTSTRVQAWSTCGDNGLPITQIMMYKGVIYAK